MSAMYIRSFRIENYKSYYNPSILELTTGFNLITGQNNVGKTAMLEALSLGYTPKPHRSALTILRRGAQPNPRSTVTVSVALTSDEIKDTLLVPDTSFYLPLPKLGTSFAQSIGYENHDEGNYRKLKDWFFSEPELTFNLRLEKWANNEGISASSFPTYATYSPEKQNDGRYPFVKCHIANDGAIRLTGPSYQEQNSEVGFTIFNHIRNKIYTFKAQRFNVGASTFGRNPILNADASNLAEVLNILQENSARFTKFNTYVNHILPQVKWVSVKPHPSDNQTLEIKIWTHDQDTERDDLTVSLSESGTGIGQILAILYVVLTSDQPQTIIIDEPQSYLHPGAIRKLLDILKTYPQYQFIIATHSPTVISAAGAKTITMVSQHNSETVLETIDVSETEKLRLYLDEVGARLSDVFGADNILWVEGATEEVAFPLILEKLCGKSLMGTTIVGVRSTGELTGKNAEMAYQIYANLSRGKGLLPPAIGFIFDEEEKTDAERADMVRRGGGLIQFIPRRMFENYLLNPTAITAIVNSIEGFSNNAIEEAIVTEKIEQKKLEARYYPKSISDISAVGAEWIRYVHGANLLRDLFEELSETRVTYNKVKYSPKLTDYIIQKHPGELSDIQAILNTIFNT